MSRINIEDSLHRDPRFIALAKSWGEEKTVGHLFRFWVCAQEFWKRDGSLIPIVIFQMHKFSDRLFEVGLAERRPEGVYAKGSKRHFAWLLQRVQAGNKPKLSKSDKISEAGLVIPEAGPKRNGSGSEAGDQPPTPPPTPSPPPSRIQEEQRQRTFLSETVKPPKAAPPQKEKDQNAYEAVALFCREYKTRYSANYRVQAKDTSLLGTMRKTLGSEVYPEVVKAYFRMNDRDFVSKGHDVTTLHFGQTRVSLYQQTGVAPTAPVTQFKTAGEKRQDTMKRYGEMIRENELKIMEAKTNGES